MSKWWNRLIYKIEYIGCAVLGVIIFISVISILPDKITDILAVIVGIVFIGKRIIKTFNRYLK